MKDLFPNYSFKYLSLKTKVMYYLENRKIQLKIANMAVLPLRTQFRGPAPKETNRK
jgi:hypothetical protein